MPKKSAVRLNAKQEQFAEAWVRLGNADAAAREVGYSNRTVPDLTRHPGILAQREKCITEKKYVEAKATEQAIKKTAIDKAFLINRLAQLASLSPEETKGNITGQVNACGELAEIIGAKVKLSADLTKQFEGRTESEIEFFTLNGYFPNDVDSRQSRPN